MATTAFVIIHSKIALRVQTLDEMNIAGTIYTVTSVRPHNRTTMHLMLLSPNLNMIDMIIDKNAPVQTIITSLL